MLRSLYGRIKFVVAYAVQTFSASVTNIAGVDTQDFGSLCFLINVGTFSFAPANKIAITLEESDNSDMSSSNVVVAADLYNPESGSLVKALDGTEDSQSLVVVHYLGAKRYVRPVLTLTGTVSTPLGVIATKGSPQLMPPL